MASTSTDNALSLDFGLNVAKATRTGIEKIKSAVDAISKSTGNIHEDNEKLNKLFTKQQEILEVNANSTDKIVSTLQRGKNLLFLAVGIYSAKQVLDEAVVSAERFDDALQSARLAFGGRDNALAFRKEVQWGIASGKLFGEAQEFMDAAQTLSRKGVKMTQENLDLLNNWAAGANKSAAEVASAFSSAIEGNTAALEEFGISERTLRRFQRYTANTTQMRDAVMSFVKAQKQFENAAEMAPVTWKNIAQRFGAMKDMFIEAIVGHSTDPNSLQSVVKAEITAVMEFLNRNTKFFKALAGSISATVKWVVKSTGQLVQAVMGKAQSAIESVSDFTNNWKERTAGFLLYLEMIKLRVVDFYNAHADTIKTVVKWYLYYKAAKTALLISTSAISSVMAYHNSLKALILTIRSSTAFNVFIGSIQGIAQALRMTLVPALMRSRLAVAAFNLVMNTNPILLAVTALALLILNFKTLRKWAAGAIEYIREAPAWLKVLAGAFSPIIAVVVLLVKYWDKLKATVVNVVLSLRNIGVILFNAFKSTLQNLGAAIKGFWNKMTDMLPDWAKDFGKHVYNTLKTAGRLIVGFFDWLIPDWLKRGLSGIEKFVDRVVDFFYTGSESLANATALAAELSGGTGVRGYKVDESTGELYRGAKPSAAPPSTAPVPVASKPKQAAPVDNSIHLYEGAITIPSTANADEVGRVVERKLTDMQRKQTLKGRNE